MKKGGNEKMVVEIRKIERESPKNLNKPVSTGNIQLNPANFFSSDNQEENKGEREIATNHQPLQIPLSSQKNEQLEEEEKKEEHSH